MRYSGVFVFGDSLVDAGNALKLAEFADEIDVADLPSGIPSADKGYHEGRFSDGLTFADLISNKFVSTPTTTVFPFGFIDPWIGVSFQFVSDPEGNNLNFAYGGAQIRKGEEVVPDLDDQTDAFIDAVDGAADATALHLVTIGGNDVRRLVPDDAAVADAVTARAVLTEAAQELREEVRDLIQAGVRHVVVTGIPDVGIVPEYNGLPDEAARRGAATIYSGMLDDMIQQHLAGLRAQHPGATIHYVSLTEASAEVVGKLDQIFDPELLASLHNPSDVLFFDHVHPTAQAHALLAASVLDSIASSEAGEAMAARSPDHRIEGRIGAAGEVDRVVVSLAAGTTYTFEMLGISSGSGVLADPTLRIVGPGGTSALVDDDGGLGLDASLQFTAAETGTYTLELGGVGGLAGSYRFQSVGAFRAGEIDGTALGETVIGSAGADIIRGLGGNDRIEAGGGADLLHGGLGADRLQGGAGDDAYAVDDRGDLVFEGAGAGRDTVSSSIGYVLGANVEALVLTRNAGVMGVGNSLANRIDGNSGHNLLKGNAGADTLKGGFGDDILLGGGGTDSLGGGGGADRFTFDSTVNGRTNVDQILDFSSVDDTIVLDRTIFREIGRDGSLAPEAFREGASARDADDRILYDQASGNLFYDADGAGGTAAILFARVAVGTALDHTDFIAVA